MGKIFETIDERLAAWIGQQRVFFVATAPRSDAGSINCSPKGGDSFRVLGGSEVAYQDFTGSGIETIAHLRENGRIVIMFCAFEGPPRIVRLHGHGSVITDGDAEYPFLLKTFPANVGTRAIVRVAVTRISDSCGYAVPRYDFAELRDTLDRWALAKGEEGLAEYRRAKNASSIDGLPGLGSGRE